MVQQTPKYTDINSFLDSDNPWEYDLKLQFNMKLLCEFLDKALKSYKNETISRVNNLSCENPIDRFLRYKNQPRNDPFDCDGSGDGNQAYLCWLSREVYRRLWSWEDVNKTTVGTEKVMVNRYGFSCFDSEQPMGPETLNSFQTTFTAYANLCESEQNRLKAIIEQFACSTHYIGNFTLTFEGYNRYVGNDYWDIKLKKQFLDNHPKLFKKYINTFFLWDYLDVNHNIKSLFRKTVNTPLSSNTPCTDSHSAFIRGEKIKSFLPASSAELEVFVGNVNWLIRRRGIFMVAMLRLEQSLGAERYTKLRECVFVKGDTIYSSYDAVFAAVEAYLENDGSWAAAKELLETAQRQINYVS